MKDTTRCNYCLHESGHICGSLSRNLSVEAEIGTVIANSGHRFGAITYHYFGSPEDDAFIIYCGIEASKRFCLGDAGCLKDWADAEKIAAPEDVKRRAQDDAKAFIQHTEMIIKMAYALYQSGSLDVETTRKIYDGEIDVTVPPDFLTMVDKVATMVWQLVRDPQAAANSSSPS